MFTHARAALATLIPKTSVLVGILVGVLLCSPVVLVCGFLAGPQLESHLFPILRLAVGRDRREGPPFNTYARAPFWKGDRACWQLAMLKLRTAHTVSLNFFLHTDFAGDIPLRVNKIDEATGEGRYFVYDHPAGESWVNTYCTDVTPDIRPDEEMLIGGNFVYNPPHRLWQVVQPIPTIHVSPSHH